METSSQIVNNGTANAFVDDDTSGDSGRGGDLSPPDVQGAKHRIVLVTGMSGAGRSSTMDALEDLGYQTVQGVPAQMIAEAACRMAPKAEHGVAFSLDMRSPGFSLESMRETAAKLRANTTHNVQILFLDCDDAVLRRRFVETRRRHALAETENVSIGVARERALLSPLRGDADHAIDTTNLSVTDLRREIAARFATDAAARLSVTIMSFGFKYGPPTEADILFDVRFLANPHWRPELRPHTGESTAVAAYVEADPGFDAFFEKLADLVLTVLPRYEQEAKSYVCIAIGCTGGKHRSVVVAGKLAKRLSEAGWPPIVRHRDMPGGS